MDTKRLERALHDGTTAAVLVNPNTPFERELFEDRKVLALAVVELRHHLKTANETISRYEEQWIEEHV